jgi:adenylosuccinate synthase
MLNGANELMMMKTDVLNDFNMIKVATKYNVKGELSDELPGGSITENLNSVYESLPGWNQDLDGSEKYEDFPTTLKDYVAFIERYVGIPIKIVSMGPDRSQTVFK